MSTKVASRQVWQPSRRSLILGAAMSLGASDAGAWRSGGSVISSLRSAYVAKGFGILIHFEMNTFTGLEIGTGNESPNTFNPTAGRVNIDQWVSTCVAAKAKYAIVIAKHHSGFCMWPTATTAHSISSSSPWYAANGNQDIVGEFISKFRAAGIAPYIYFSIWDEAYGIANPSATQAQYKAYTQAQITELLSNYGSVGALWMDGDEWHYGSYYPWATSAERAAFITGLQPNCLAISNNHQGATNANSDIAEYEKTFPLAGNIVPSEVVDTIRSDGNWFWTSPDILVQSSTILANISACRWVKTTYLLACQPDTTGAIPSEQAALLATVGASL